MKSAVYCEIAMPGLSAAYATPIEAMVAYRPAEVAVVLARVEALAKEGCWVVGFVAYEAATGLDGALVGQAPVDGLPLAAFAAYRVSGAPRARRGCLWGAWHDTTPDAAFDSAVTRIRTDIAEGRHYQVNYTTRLRTPFFGDGAALFDALRLAQPGAYSVHLDFGRWQVCSVSPELFFHWRPAAGGVSPWLTFRPMKGTAPRDADPVRDQALADGLHNSAKDRAENLMIVDLLRNDASRVAELGSVAVPSLFEVEPWATVWQMTSTIECRPRPEIGLPELYAALFPCGSVTGAPKAEAMRAIRELETEPRGVYCGAIGVVMPGGEARFNVGIRTVVIDTERNVAECGIGSGIVADSTVDGEREEWQIKQRFLRRACPDYELFETLLWRHGRYWLLKEHLERLGSSATTLAFRFDRTAALAALTEAARKFGSGCRRMRLRLSMDGALGVDAEPFIRQRGAVDCAPASRPVESADPRLRHKTTRRDIYAWLAQPDVFDTLLFNERNEATEFTRGNLVVKIGGRLLTPALECGLLPGVFRAALLARGKMKEAVLTLAEVASAERLWFINSLRGAMPVRLKMPDTSSEGSP
jgi:para-aminobenzoate synthetase / 4-amino-4-deoxychorismate lyase